MTIHLAVCSFSQLYKTIEVNAGNLGSSLSDNEKKSISNLKLTGSIDARDFKTMRDSMPLLVEIDISEVNIKGYSGRDGTFDTSYVDYKQDILPTCAFFDYNKAEGKKNLKSINTPNSIVAIHWSAFCSCDSLSKVILHDSLKIIDAASFMDCTLLDSLYIPQSVNQIGPGAFRNCSSLVSVNLPDNINTIEDRLFLNCKNLETINIPNNINTIGTGAFEECVNLKRLYIPETVRKLNKYSFLNCSAEIEVNDSNLFYSNDNGLLIKNHKTVIHCPTSIKGEIIIPQYITHIGLFAFMNCTYLTKVKFSNILQIIDGSSFVNCIRLKEIVFPKSLTSISYGAFKNCCSIDSIIIPSNILTIKSSAFSGCTGLQYVNIKSQLKSIEADLFNNCKSLKEVNIPNSVETINYQAFYECLSLTKVELPESLSVIESNAFRYCSNLDSIICKSNKPIDLTNKHKVFFDVDLQKSKLFVPRGSKEYYQNAVTWENFKNIIEYEK